MFLYFPICCSSDCTAYLLKKLFSIYLDSADCTVTRLGAGRFPATARDFSLIQKRPDRLCDKSNW